MFVCLRPTLLGGFPFATCFICKERGHLTRSCPDNPRGLYPQGGGCKQCGSVEHLSANCPERHGGKHPKIRLGLMTDATSADAHDDEDQDDRGNDANSSASDDDHE